MPIKTNITDLRPARDKFKKSIRLLSGAFNVLQYFPDGMIDVYPWDSSMDEWALVRQPKIRSDEDFMIQAVERVAALKGCPVGQICFGDISTILLVSRAMKSGCTLAVRPKCPKCGHVHSEEPVTVPDSLKKVGEKADGFVGHDEFELDVSKDTVSIRPLIVDDIVAIKGRGDDEKKVISETMAVLLWGVVSVGGGKPDSIDEVVRWYRSLPPQDQSQFNMKRDELDPHLSPDLEFVCDKCGHEFSDRLNLNIGFFRSRSRGGPA